MINTIASRLFAVTGGIIALFLSGLATAAEVTPVFSTDLPNIPGKTGEILEVSYAPGESSDAHRHNANTFVYVLEGTVVMAVKGGEEQTLSVGQSFYETPTDIHTVSRNASDTEPAKVLVFFVKDTGAPASLPVE
jgi:quercetin dioxygenase-like cupin family protein